MLIGQVVSDKSANIHKKKKKKKYTCRIEVPFFCFEAFSIKIENHRIQIPKLSAVKLYIIFDAENHQIMIRESE